MHFPGHGITVSSLSTRKPAENCKQFNYMTLNWDTCIQIVKLGMSWSFKVLEYGEFDMKLERLRLESSGRKWKVRLKLESE